MGNGLGHLLEVKTVAELKVSNLSPDLEHVSDVSVRVVDCNELSLRFARNLNEGKESSFNVLFPSGFALSHIFLDQIG